ncbi:hypothetical protein [Rathayibacter rathayi]|uniref:hypothetical protein n=1 Tax=Rathayibacter rathayi TaxID=33887 RepID=UPI0015E27218|nr:hypothetical protein [Rathayibacter rathayi]
MQNDVRVRLRLGDGSTLCGIDLPVVELLATRDESRAVGHLGPDPLRSDWDADEAVRRLSRLPDRPVGDHAARFLLAPLCARIYLSMFPPREGESGPSRMPNPPQPRTIRVKDGQQVVSNPTPFRVTPVSQVPKPNPRPR